MKLPVLTDKAIHAAIHEGLEADTCDEVLDKMIASAQRDQDQAEYDKVVELLRIVAKLADKEELMDYIIRRKIREVIGDGDK